MQTLAVVAALSQPSVVAIGPGAVAATSQTITATAALSRPTLAQIALLVSLDAQTIAATTLITSSAVRQVLPGIGVAGRTVSASSLVRQPTLRQVPPPDVASGQTIMAVARLRMPRVVQATLASVLQSQTVAVAASLSQPTVQQQGVGDATLIGADAGRDRIAETAARPAGHNHGRSAVGADAGRLCRTAATHGGDRGRYRRAPANATNSCVHIYARPGIGPPAKFATGYTGQGRNTNGASGLDGAGQSHIRQRHYRVERPLQHGRYWTAKRHASPDRNQSSSSPTPTPATPSGSYFPCWMFGTNTA